MEYIKEITSKKCYELSNVVIVTIPGKNSGIAFARSIIQMLQQLMRKEIQEKCQFDYFWVIDDDIHSATFWDDTSFKSCTFDSVLINTQKAMTEFQNKQDCRISGLFLMNNSTLQSL
eukprot:TRINITY_DN17162_c0_g1_i1.p1 TRINITY_DN17162_c0_g1~~TRINITY_DN17162_c0_g1_i1.p1  ORF type:complete len:117 (-),score=21.08 TRINITY_DN17162_c0_g1_i1:556-906(-)